MLEYDAWEAQATPLIVGSTKVLYIIGLGVKGCLWVFGFRVQGVGSRLLRASTIKIVGIKWKIPLKPGLNRGL